MIVDSSVVACICLGEEDAETFVAQLESAERLQMSSATFVEAAAVLDSRRPGSLDVFVAGVGIEVVPVDLAQAELARAAYQRFGRGSGHRAGLNFGDCFSYALAMTAGEPLLFKGNDFTHTDVPRLP